ncbi:uncharacterized protein LDX57_007086 [Aspergillus melleus]|uniref:uncharacterized protein n=1 Tax=Aspergillus melleus TaxID=138277 RepID=UPI001E8E5010|nr:uncharacterized protein LDX57_007086 [Aspergillus melleus]KAH8429423.1 hypothetical protein LDX57_007086 [Aspergillus melleus]
MKRKTPEEKEHLHQIRETGTDSDAKPSATWQAALLLGSAMVARGEIGLLIIEIGYNESGYVSKEGFITGVWAILLNTIIGPVVVGILVKLYGKQIGEGVWGIQPSDINRSQRPEVQSHARS